MGKSSNAGTRHPRQRKTDHAYALRTIWDSDHLQAFDFDANYNWATNKQLSQYRIINFATHGIIDQYGSVRAERWEF